MSAGGDVKDDDVFVNLTPAVDILTTLLFFLLVGYKSQADVVQGANEVELPTSISEKGLVLTITVLVNNDGIKLPNYNDAYIVALTEGRVREKDLDTTLKEKIVPLYNALLKIRDMEQADTSKIDKSAILLAADKRLKSDTVTKVMKTCAMAGFPNFRFAVSKQ